jgi:hypothetical protein
MQRVQDFQNPNPQPVQETEFQDEWTPRTGILVGGMKELQWNGIGEQSVGHHDYPQSVVAVYPPPGGAEK